MAHQLWTQKYIPKTIDEFVWRDANSRTMIEQWLVDGVLPHCLFSGHAGTGKTSLAKLLMRVLNIPDIDLLTINASRDRHIDIFQGKITGFIDAWPLNPSGVKYILLDEADRLPPLSQDFLRTEMVDYSDICRFILTANKPERITEAIHSRVQQLNFPSLDREEFFMRVGTILIDEKIAFELDSVTSHIDAAYPDLRKCLNTLQQYSRNGSLQPICRDEVNSSKDYLLTVIDLFKAGKFTEGRKLIINQARLDDYEDIYKFFYTNVETIWRTNVQQEDALLTIRKGLINHGLCADVEINLSATLVELTRISAKSGH